MALINGRFVLHYRNGDTEVEKREDPNCWNNLPKFAYGCFDCGNTNEEFAVKYYCVHCDSQVYGGDLICKICDKKRRFRAEYECLECNSTDVSRKSLVAAIGIMPDPTEVMNNGKPVLDPETDNPLRLTLPEYIMRGSRIYDYQFFQAKMAELDFSKAGAKPETVGIRIGAVIDEEGHCVVMEMNKAYAIRTYYTTVDSLGLDYELFELNLAECGVKIG